MNAFVAGNVNEVKNLAYALLKATNVVEEATKNPDVEIMYKDGKIIISYRPEKNTIEEQ